MIEMIWKSWSKVFEFSSRHRRLFILSIPTKFFRDSPQFTIMDLQSQTEQINFTPMWLAVLTFRRLLMNSFNNLNFCMILLFFFFGALFVYLVIVYWFLATFYSNPAVSNKLAACAR